MVTVNRPLMVDLSRRQSWFIAPNTMDIVVLPIDSRTAWPKLNTPPATHRPPLNGLQWRSARNHPLKVLNGLA